MGGLRGEQTSVTAEGPLNDPTLNYQRNASGQVVLDAAGRPVALTGTPLEVALRTRIDRGAHAEKEYLRLFPSLNASYNLRENLVARVSWSQSVGRPNLNQYAGGITLPDTELPPAPNIRLRAKCDRLLHRHGSVRTEHAHLCTTPRPPRLRRPVEHRRKVPPLSVGFTFPDFRGPPFPGAVRQRTAGPCVRPLPRFGISYGPAGALRFSTLKSSIRTLPGC